MSEGITNGETPGSVATSEFERLRAENEYLRRRIAETGMILRGVRETLEECQELLKCCRYDGEPYSRR